MKLLLDFLPIILFFVTYKYAESNKEWAAAFATEHFGFLVSGGKVGLDEGSVILAFAGNPVRLQEWTITDAQGGRTRTQLTTLTPASGLDASLFRLTDPTRRPGRN